MKKKIKWTLQVVVSLAFLLLVIIVAIPNPFKGRQSAVRVARMSELRQIQLVL